MIFTYRWSVKKNEQTLKWKQTHRYREQTGRCLLERREESGERSEIGEGD